MKTNKNEIVILDLFSGIGGFAKGFYDAGYTIKKHYFSEIDKHAIANYKYNFKDAEYIGSITDVRGVKLDRPDIITFGSPCQDFSLAGKRLGMEGERSSLIMEAIRLISETKPSVFIWENVKGTFSSNNGADFWGIISAFTNIGGYRLEWQLCNTSWFLPQNRERIYLIGHLAGRSEFGLFPIRENDQLSNNKSKSEKGQSQTKISPTITKGNLRADDTYISIPKKAGCITGGGHSGGLHSDMTIIRSIATPNRKDKQQNGKRVKSEGEPSFTITAQEPQGVMINEYSIRRLTEIECERLQGFPDDWTKLGIYEVYGFKREKGKKKYFKIKDEVREISKTQRYKMIGNAVTTNIPKEIVSRLVLIK